MVLSPTSSEPLGLKRTALLVLLRYTRFFHFASYYQVLPPLQHALRPHISEADDRFDNVRQQLPGYNRTDIVSQTIHVLEVSQI